MMVSIGHMFVLEVVNVYCMVPLIWRSVLNAPLFAIFHLIIAVNGIIIIIVNCEFENMLELAQTECCCCIL